jgi:hypothetical protein
MDGIIALSPLAFMNLRDGVSGVLQYNPDPGRTGLSIGGGVYGGISIPPLDELQLSILGLIA